MKPKLCPRCPDGLMKIAISKRMTYRWECRACGRTFDATHGPSASRPGDPPSVATILRFERRCS